MTNSNSPIKQIRNGIEKRNWDVVCEGYSRLTGEEVKAPGVVLEDYHAALLEIAEVVEEALRPTKPKSKGRPAMVVDQETGEGAPVSLVDEDNPVPPVSTKKKRAARKKKAPPGPQEDPAELGDPDALAEESRLLSQKLKGRQKERRSPYEPLSVKCNVCREPQEGVRPGELHEGAYTCDRCVRTRRG